MRYRFHIKSDGRIYWDEGGENFATAADALKHGSVIAHELDDGSFASGFSVSIVDENDMEIGSVPIAAKRSPN